MLETKLNYHDRSNMIQSIMKSKQDNDMNDCIGVISIEYDTELSRPIG